MFVTGLREVKEWSLCGPGNKEFKLMRNVKAKALRQDPLLLIQEAPAILVVIDIFHQGWKWDSEILWSCSGPHILSIRNLLREPRLATGHLQCVPVTNNQP